MNEDIDDVYDLGPLQESMLVHSLCYPGHNLFARQICIQLSPAIDISVLRRASEHLAARTPVLRTAFVWEGLDTPVQVVRSTADIKFRVIDLVDEQPGASSIACDNLTQERRESFDLQRGALFRILTLRKRSRLDMVWTYHHLLLDAWSVRLLLEELALIYRSLVAGATPPPTRLRPYREFIAIAKRAPTNESERYWRSELRGFSRATPISKRSEAPITRAPAAASRELHIELRRILTNGVEAVSRRLEVTPYTVYEAAWALLLSKRSGTDDVVFGTTLSGREEAAGMENVVGLLSNVLPRRVRIDPMAPLSEWLRALHRGSADRFQHQHVPLKKIRGWSEIVGSEPLFLSTLVHETAQPDLPGFIEPDTTARDRGWSGHPLTVFFAPSQEFIWFVYDSTFIEEREVDTIAKGYHALLRDIVTAERNSLVGALPVLEDDGLPVLRTPGPSASAAPRPLIVLPAHASSTWLEERLETFWRDCLHKERIGWNENVFDLGADSISLLRIQTRLEHEFGADIPLLDLFESTTITQLARRLRGDPLEHQAPLLPPEPRREREKSGIAVIGMYVNAPGAPDVDSFWRVIREGREAVSFFTDQELEHAGVPPSVRADPRYVAAGVLVPDIDRFDAPFFGVSRGEAELIDPQHRRFLQAAWNALEASGYDPQRINVPVGVYASASLSTYLLANLLSNASHREIAARGGLLIQLNECDALSTLISYKLDLKGPSVTVQTNCSSSLVAVHLACQGLRTGECDMALAGGVSINVHQDKGYFYEEGLYFSPDGHTRPFDAGASGTIFGSGLGLVVLKRLEEALAAGDEIHAVILGSALSNDGSAKAGFTAPNVAGQARAIAEALAGAGVSAESIGYVEAHGTGTPLGDFIEVEALTRVFRQQTEKRAFCCLGSAKANFGHLDKAAGIIGLIKACLVVKHGELPPLANFQQASPHLKLWEGPFYIRTNPAEWQTGGIQRRAGVSSFGIGGTNAHAVVEEAPPRPPAMARRAAQLLTWSARTPAALEAATDALAASLEQDPKLNLANVAYVGHVGRSMFPCRRVLVAESGADAAGAMRARDRHRLHEWVAPPASQPPPVVFLFPGGGVRYRAVAAGIYRAEPVFREHIARAHAVLEDAANLDLVRLLTVGASLETGDTLTLLVALFSLEYALARLLMHWGIHPAAVAGHSLGEYTAACVAGIFEFEDALRLLVTRGRLMRETPAAGMLAVFEGEVEVRQWTCGNLHLSAVNSADQCVVSGPLEEIQAFQERLAAAGTEHHVLDVEAASHTPLMQPVAKRLTEAAGRLPLRPPRIPMVSGATGRWLSDADAVRPEYWGEHLTRTVRFADALATIDGAGENVLLEVGPGSSLANLARQRMPAAEQERAIALLPTSSIEQDDETALLEGVGKAWLRGVAIDWGRFHEGESLRRTPLPTYPFERRRYWIEEPRAAEAEPGLARRRDIADWFYLPSWRQTLPPPLRPEGGAGDRILLLAPEGSDFEARLSKWWRKAGHEVIEICPGERLEVGLDELCRPQLRSARIVDCLSLQMPAAEDAATLARSHEHGLHRLLALLRAVVARPELVRAEVSVVSSQCHAIESRDVVRPERAVIAAVCRVMAQEYPMLRCRSLEVEAEEAAADQVAAEIVSGRMESVVAYRGGRRWVRWFEPVRVEEPAPDAGPWRRGGVYLITGGVGKIGLALAEHIVERASATVVLVGRNAPAGRLRESSIHFLQGDVSDRSRMSEIVGAVRQRFGGLHGVVHAAGITDAGWFSPLSEADTRVFQEHFRPKAHGFYALESALAEVGELEFCLLVSSLASHIGGVSHAAYAAANAFLDGCARARRQAQRPHWISVASELWRFAEGGASGAGERSRLGTSLESLRMNTREGLAALDRALTLPVPEIAISTCDLNQRYRQWAIGEEGAAGSGFAPAAQVHERSESLAACVAPRTPLEQEVARVWAEVLGFERVGVEDDFFRLGGHSISAIRIVARLRSTVDAEISVADVLKHSTVARLTETISHRSVRRGAPAGGGR